VSSRSPSWSRPVAWIAGRAASLLAGGGAIVLFVSLWLPWFVTFPVCARSVSGFLPCHHVHFSAWDAFNVAVVALAVLGAAAIIVALAGPPIATRLAPALGLTPAFGRTIAGLLVAALGWATVALSVYAVHRPAVSIPVLYTVPRAAVAVPSLTLAPDFGFFVALLGAGGITGGGLWTALSPPDAQATRRVEDPDAGTSD